MTETLLRFLDYLAEPVVPLDFHEKILECTSLVQCKGLVAQFPSVHIKVFYYIISFLKHILAHSAKNKVSKESLGIFKFFFFWKPYD